MKLRTVTDAIATLVGIAFAIFAVAFLIALLSLALSGCGGSPGAVGEACAEDSDCTGPCLLELTGELEDGESISLPFPGGMCTEECETGGVWEEFDICLVFRYSGEKYLFPGCRNDDDCRADEGYYCATVGYDASWDLARACVPEGA